MALFALAACESPPAYDLRRLHFNDRTEETLEAGGVARPGFRVDQKTRKIATDLAGLTAGRLSLAVAPTAEAEYGDEVDVEFKETGWRALLGIGINEKCTLRWGDPGTPVDAPWQDCAFEVPREMAAARLVVRRSEGSHGDVLVSQPRLEGMLPGDSPNVFVLLLDAARFDMLRPFRDGAPFGDHLEALAHDSVTLTQLHSSSSWTRPAVTTLFTGLRADRHRVQERGDVLAEGIETLAELLRDAGYSTTAWSTNPNLLPVWGMAQGFDTFMDLGGEAWINAKTDGSVVLSRLRGALAVKGPEPAFYYLHFMDPHAPYKPGKEQLDAVRKATGITSMFPRPMAIMTRKDDWSAFVDYMGELVDTDNHIGTFVKMLKDKGLYDDSLILVVADHGEEFLDHGGRDHGRTLYEEVLHVPALIKLPGNRLAGTVFQDPASFEDLMPTVLSELEVDSPADIDGRVLPLDGKTMLDPKPHVASLRLDGFRQVAILDPPWKLIENDANNSKQLYDLTADPQERTNVASLHLDVVEKLGGELDTALGHGQTGWHILLCGNMQEATLDLTLRTDAGTPEWFGFDEHEAGLEPGQTDVWHLHPALIPNSVQQAAFGRFTTVVLPEHDEVLIPADGADKTSVDIRSAGDDTFDTRLGTSDTTRAVKQLAVDSTSKDVVVASGVRVACTPPPVFGRPAPPIKRPFVRVWYEAPPKTVAAETLDPALRERLKALGYVQ